MISAAKIIEKSDSAKKSVVFLLCRIKSSFVNTQPKSSESPLCKGFEVGWVLDEDPT